MGASSLVRGAREKKIKLLKLGEEQSSEIKKIVLRSEIL
jgi:hypothetical protein